jgi:hypothetical protein
MLKFHQRTETELDPETGKKRVIPFKEQYWLDHPVSYYMDQIFDCLPFLQNKGERKKDLTFIESEIMRHAMSNMVADGLPCYPVHDCLMVREVDVDSAIAFLQQSLFEHLGFVCVMVVSSSKSTYFAIIPQQ